MEGGRSRDGKIRPAQTGIFRLFVEQIHELKMGSEVYFAPISITYDRVPEMESLIREIKGLKKKKETTLSLFQSMTKVFQNHGDVHFHFDEPIKLESLLPSSISKKTFHDLSVDIFSKIQKSKPVTPSGIVATILLASNKITNKQEVLAKIQYLVKALMPCKNCMSEKLANIQKEGEGLIRDYQAYGWYKFESGSITINKRKRLEMNYYKNDVVPYLIPYSISSFAKSLDAEELPLVEKILKHEYPYANAYPQTCSPDMEIFFQKIHHPILQLYRQIFQMILEISLNNLSHPETHKNIRKILKERNFQPREVLTTEAIRSVCRFFEINSETWKDHSLNTTHIFEKIFSDNVKK